MFKGIARRIIVLAGLIAMGGCAANGTQPPANALLSAADASAMIRIEVRAVEPPAAIDETELAATMASSNPR